MDFRVSLTGFAVGMLVGLTGMGGGAMMTPLLILFGWARPSVAVGTDLVWNALTKSVGALVHYRQKTVDFKIVKRLSIGSIPGALAGIVLLAYLRRLGVASMDRLIVQVLGVALIVVAVTLVLRSIMKANGVGAEQPHNGRLPDWVVSVLGAMVGFLVSLTSVGSGSLIVACLVTIYPAIPLRRIVGSDILNALFLVGVSALGHLGLGNMNFALLAALLVGSLPGVWLGSKMSAVIPEKTLRPVLATTLFVLGYKLL